MERSKSTKKRGRKPSKSNESQRSESDYSKIFKNTPYPKNLLRKNTSQDPLQHAQEVPKKEEQNKSGIQRGNSKKDAGEAQKNNQAKNRKASKSIAEEEEKKNQVKRKESKKDIVD